MGSPIWCFGVARWVAIKDLGIFVQIIVQRCEASGMENNIQASSPKSSENKISAICAKNELWFLSEDKVRPMLDDPSWIVSRYLFVLNVPATDQQPDNVPTTYQQHTNNGHIYIHTYIHTMRIKYPCKGQGPGRAVGPGPPRAHTHSPGQRHTAHGPAPTRPRKDI